ncbi:hypothetical protein FN846DRAFT_1021721, partial [Sphaerosporella brunnea]
MCSAAGSAAELPLIKSIGVGLSCTVSSILLFFGAVLIWVTAKWGQNAKGGGKRRMQGNRNLEVIFGASERNLESRAFVCTISSCV